tara:strand:+ start:3152 stop:4957 length:1806 start_codon:yes stop_codon:yes gene_type:complete
MYYSFLREENISNIFYISDYILNYHIGIYTIIISIFFVIIKIFNPKFKKYNFLIFSIYALGVYIALFFSYDETFINLEHTYNLFHHQKLSMSSDTMVNGTVDYVLCILLYPFSASRELLIIGNYVINFIFLFFHFWILFLYIKNKTRITFLILIVFASYIPFIWIFGKGFGNNIVSLFFFYSLILYISDKTNKSLIIAALLPILRPDAILYSATIFFAHFLNKKKIEIKYIIICLLGFLSVFAITYFLYGHIVPLPMEFKSLSIDEFSLIDFETVFTNVLKSYNLFFLILFLISYFFIKENIYLTKINYFFIPLLSLLIFYSLNPETHKFPRYSMGLLGFQALFYIFLITDRKIKFHFNKKFNFNINLDFLSRYQFFFSLLIMLIIIPLIIYIQNTRYYGARVDSLSVGGQIMGKITPKKWIVAVTELNTFGFSNDLIIYDMWGYSNDIISKSKTRSYYKKKIDPGLFLKKSPEIFWYRTRKTDTAKYYATKLNPEAILVTDNFSQSQNFLGNMNKILLSYDFYSLFYKNYETLILVNKNNKKQFFENLSKNHFNLNHSKILDLEKFKLIYDKCFLGFSELSDCSWPRPDNFTLKKFYQIN